MYLHHKIDRTDYTAENIVDNKKKPCMVSFVQPATIYLANQHNHKHREEMTNGKDVRSRFFFASVAKSHKIQSVMISNSHTNMMFHSAN